MTNLFALCGSLRHASLNRKLLNKAIRLYRPDEYKEVDISRPLFDEDMETTGFPVKVKEVAAVIEKADAIIIASPEYNKGIFRSSKKCTRLVEPYSRKYMER